MINRNDLMKGIVDLVMERFSGSITASEVYEIAEELGIMDAPDLQFYSYVFDVLDGLGMEVKINA